MFSTIMNFPKTVAKSHQLQFYKPTKMWIRDLIPPQRINESCLLVIKNAVDRVMSGKVAKIATNPIEDEDQYKVPRR